MAGRPWRPRYEVDPITGCWMWQLSLTRTGYGQVTYGGKKWAAHRLFYEQHVGPIPEKHHVHHECRTRSCVNPDHLRAVTSSEHRLLDSALQPRSHCQKGHPYTPENTRHTSRGARVCRACRKIWDADKDLKTVRWAMAGEGT